MKPLISIAIVALSLGIVAGSCKKKDYECACRADDSDKTVTYKLNSENKSDADDECNLIYVDNYANTNLAGKVTCEVY